MRTIIFFSILTISISFLNFFIYKRLKHLNIKFLNVFFITLTSLQIISFLSIRNNLINIKLENLSFISIVFTLCVFASFLSFYLIKNSIKKYTKFNPDRRKFLKLGTDIWVLLIGFLLSCKTIYNSCFDTKINSFDIGLKNLPNDLQIAVISDLHLGKFLRGDFLEKIVNKINDLNPDCVFIVGDLIDFDPSFVKHELDGLNNFKMPVFYVNGNHEYYYGIDKVMSLLGRYNIKILDNKNELFRGINIVGVNDLTGFKMGSFIPNLNEALQNIDKSKPIILLAHQPKFINNFVNNQADLCICGHTHGGSFPPFSLLVYLDQKFLHGLFKLKDKQLFVSSGVGFWGPPIRFFAPSEIAVLNLHRA